MGGFYGTPTSATPRMAGKALAPSVTLTPDQFDELKVVFDMTNRTTSFYHTPFGGSEQPVGSPNVIVWDVDVGAAARPPVGTTTISRVEIINWNRQDVYNGDMTIDDINVTRCPGTCFSDVTPLQSDPVIDATAQAPTGGEVVWVPSYDYTITNTSSVASINWTAAESNPDGTPADYPWLSLSPLNGGPLVPSDTDTVTASMTRGSLGAGLYAGNIRFEDDCDADPATYHLRTVQLVVGTSPWFVDAFHYADGNLALNGGWVGGQGGVTVAADPDDPTNQVMKIIMDPNAAAGDGASSVVGFGTAACEDGIFTVVVKVKSSPEGTAGKGWGLSVDDPNGANLAAWDGQYNQVRGRNAGAGIVTPYVDLPSTEWHELRAVIDVLNNTTTYYFDDVALGAVNPQSHGVDLGSFQSGVRDVIGSISVTRVDNGPLTGYVLLDDLEVIGCPGECMAGVTPTRYQIGFTQLPWAPDASTTPVPETRDYVFSNDGLVAITSYSVEEVTRSGSSTDYPWILLSKTGGGPFSPGEDDGASPVTATFSSAGLSSGPHLGYLKFTDSCNNQTFMRAIKLNVGDCLTETFDDYGNGPLVDSPGWEVDPGATFGGGTAISSAATPIQVLDGVLEISGSTINGSPVEATQSITAQHRNINNCPVCPEDGLTVVRLRVKGHTGGSALWEIHFTPLGGTDLAAWRGSASTATPMAAQDGAGAAVDLTGGGTWDELEARINVHAFELEGVPATSTAFYLNGALQETLAHGLGDARVRRVRIVRIGNDFSQDADPVVEIDRMSISACGPVCGSPVFDSNRDHEVDYNDLQTLAGNGLIDCATGPAPPAEVFDALSFQCQCLDINNDRAIDMLEFAAFQRCVSLGTPGPADPNCAD